MKQFGKLLKWIIFLEALTATSLLARPLDLTILHINDHHSHLSTQKSKIVFNGQKIRIKLGGFAKMVTQFKKLEAQNKNVLKIHAGDALVGDVYYTFFEGKADAAMMNLICFDVFELGNHEFDGGDAKLANFLGYLKTSTCQTSVLAANIKPKIGTPLAPKTSTDFIRPYIIKIYDGEKVGIIGIDIVGKTVGSSNPLPTTKFLNEEKTVRKYAQILERQGVNKIILVSHNGYANDLKMAKNIPAIDVIVGGDSHTLLDNTLKDVGLKTQGAYPTVVQKKGGQACVVQSWEYSKVVGELQVRFDNQGRVVSCDGLPHVLLGKSFKTDKTKKELSGALKATVLGFIKAKPELSIVKDDLQALAVKAQFDEKVNALSQQVIGYATEDLCLERIPGQGYSKVCGKKGAKVTANITYLVTDAFLKASKKADIALQNAGGVRTDLIEGEIRAVDIYRLLPFKNTLVNLRLTGAQIKQVLEEAIDYALNPTGSTGAYPYAVGLFFDVDLTQKKFNRVSNLRVQTKSDQIPRALKNDEVFTVVTNSYIAEGKDGYRTFGEVAKKGLITNTYIDYAQVFIDYVKAQKTLQAFSEEMHSTQKFIK